MDTEEQENMTLGDFLRNRGISETTIVYLHEQKIDCEAICAMTEDDLKKIIPAYGDRIAVKNFAKKNLSSTKQSLIERLKAKFNSKSQNTSSRTTQISTKIIPKPTRIIEIGWLCMHEEENRYRQVRTRQGGGTRRVTIDKTSRCTEVLENAKKLFFPGGVSTKGPITDFKVELVDYKSHKFDQNLTIQEMYEMSALGTLRFYLATTYNGEDGRTVVKDDDFIPATISTRRSARLENVRATTISETSFTSEETSQGEASSFLSSYTPLFDEDTDGYTDDYELLNLDENNIYNLPSLHNIPQPTIENLIVHRGNVFKELLEAMKVRNIQLQNVHIEMILPNGSSEQAEDMGGVLRDSISEFFTTFYEICTMGADFKVPCLRHDLQKEEWQAIAKIISQSYESEGYFPIKIAPVFIKECFGQIVEDDEVLNNFFKYVSSSDSYLLKTALEKFEDVEFDDIIEFCNSYEAKLLPNKENFKQMLMQIAKEELIQKPSFVKECFSPYLKLLNGRIDLDQMYSKLQPTDRNIISLLEIDDNLTTEEKQIVTYLKKFIKECDAKTREAFLRFCTGSDLANQSIKIDFIGTQGFARVPVAHTCSKLLQIPISYENFMTFRSELNNVLSSNIWIMDII